MTALNKAQRERLAALADILVPAGHGMPSASEAGGQEDCIARVFKSRPDLAGIVSGVLTAATQMEPLGFIADMERREPERFNLFFQAIAGAYFLSPEVRRLIGYDGQRARDLPRSGFGGEDLLASMMGRHKRFRTAAGLTE